ncbi:MAG: hypothetical protein O3C21_03890, partial [Verrucomicrobia bacterium]|nr:hypothetical protein [Verrucomicrobiota bacterium]
RIAKNQSIIIWRRRTCAARPVPTKGSADLCLIASTSIEEIVDHLNQAKVEIELGRVARTGAIGAIRSVYVRDPDQNLVEVSIFS